MTKPFPHVDDNIKPYLNEIAERLWSNPSHATIMVGAGFSKNANFDFPDWAALGDLFFEKIHSRKPDPKKGEDRYLNALKLADEVQAAFGRPVLEQLLRSSIPDKSSKPSPLHIQLLKLPWSDILTTNYDTLLDRASESVASQKFDVVISKKDLVYSEKPRIVKLHGSFSSERPLIITEEDYRTYPKKHAPFVNTVQQSLLENTLCLIGFSGDDPNFLQWVGWIRDNLGEENSPNIYLIGIFNLTTAETKLLSNRGITLIEFSQCEGVGNSHSKALERFFDYLLSRKEEDSRLDWPTNQKTHSPDSKQTVEKIVKNILEEWRTDRNNYPGWVVVPEDRRSSLWGYTKYWTSYLSVENSVLEPLDLEFLYERNWRLERCLIPIGNDTVEYHEAVLSKYWPFQEKEPEGASIVISNEIYDDFDWGQIRIMWVHLTLALLRYYREEGLVEGWSKKNSTLSQLVDYLSQKDLAFLYYERTLFAIFQFDIKKTKQELDLWPTNFSLPFWEAKRAGILAEIGQMSDAEDILEQSLIKIRSKLSLKPVTTDYTLVSEEASIMLLYRHIKSANDFNQGKYSSSKTITEEFSARWDTLRRYKCDPWNELSIFGYKLEQSYQEHKDTTKSLTFDIGKVDTTSHFVSTNDEVITAYMFLRFFEVMGLPVNTSGASFKKDAIVGALERIAKYSPSWAVVTLFRVGDTKVVDKLFNRQAIQILSAEIIDDLVVNYLRVLSHISLELPEENPRKAQGLADVLTRTLPEILSRFCCKCSFSNKVLILDFIKSTYDSKFKNNYEKISTLLDRLLKTLSSNEKFHLIPELLKIPFPEGLNLISERDFTNPLEGVSFSEQVIDSNKIIINPGTIEKLLSLASSDQEAKIKWGITSLQRLYEWGMLSKPQVKKLTTLVWSKVDDDGFPQYTNYYKFAFLGFPSPAEIDVNKRFRDYVKKNQFPIHSGEGVSMTNGRILLVNEIIGAQNHINWNEDEINLFFGNIIECWDKDKKNLEGDKNNRTSPFGSIANEFRARFNQLKNVLLEVVFPFFSENLPNLDRMEQVQRIIEEFEILNFKTIELKIVGFPILNETENHLKKNLELMLNSNDRDDVISGSNAIYYLIKYDKHFKKPLIDNLLIVLAQKIYWYHQVGIADGLFRIIDVVSHNSSYFKGGFELECLNILQALVRNTDLYKKDLSEAEYHDRLNVRKKTAQLAFVIFRFYESKNKTIPEPVLAWKNICEDPEEFGEIRAQWNSAYHSDNTLSN